MKTTGTLSIAQLRYRIKHQSVHHNLLRKKILQNRPLSFPFVAVLAPKVNFDSVYADVAP